MKLICAGMSKTGTKSMHVALEMLGYSVHDYPDALQRIDLEYQAFHDHGFTISDFRRMYENIDAIVDAPAFYYWEEILEAFPEAKVVLMIRDDDETWCKSFNRQLLLIDPIYFYYYTFLSPSFRRFWRFVYNSALICFSFKKVTGYETYNQPLIETLLKQAYRRHIAHVINKCPKDRLLVFKCKTGWKPICEFLSKSIPDEAFPKVNVSGEQQSALIWQTDIFKQATKEVRMAGCAIACALAVTGYVAIKKDFLRSFWR